MSSGSKFSWQYKVEDEGNTSTREQSRIANRTAAVETNLPTGLSPVVDGPSRESLISQGGSNYHGNFVARDGGHIGNRTTIIHNWPNNDQPVRGESWEPTTADITKELEDTTPLFGFFNTGSRFFELKGTSIAEGTCEWLFTTKEFIEWESQEYVTNSEPPILLLHGKPGSGKSVLLYNALQASSSTEHSDGRINLSFFFNARDKEPLECSRLGLLCGLLSQLVESLPPSAKMYETVKRMPKPRKGQSWDVNVVQDTIIKLLSETHSRVFLFLDALDECQDAKGNKSDTTPILDFIKKQVLRVHRDIRVCISARDPNQVKRGSKNIHSIDVTLYNQKDIDMFLEENLTETPLRPEFRATLKSIMSQKASNMFLWAKTVILRVNEMSEEGDEEEVIQHDLERAPEELDDLYRVLLERMDRKRKEETLVLLQLIQVAVRPLTLDEVRSALSHAKGPSATLASSFRAVSMEAFRNRLHTLSGGFVEVRPGRFHYLDYDGDHPRADVPTPVVQFIHQSVRDFLGNGKLASLDPRLTADPAAQFNCRVAELCMRILDTSDATDLAESKDHKPNPESSFLTYASQFWTLHARKGNEAIDQTFNLPDYLVYCSHRTVSTLFERYETPWYYVDKADIPDHRHLRCKQRKCDASSDPLDCQDNLLVLLAYEGCPKLVTLHVQQCQLSGRCYENRHILDRAFYRAVHRGWKETAKTVWNLSMDVSKSKPQLKIDVDMLHLAGHTPLVKACYQGKTAMVEFLLEIGANPLPDPRRSSALPLHVAAYQGYLDVVELLLRRPEDQIREMLCYRDRAGHNVLHRAVMGGQKDIVGLIIRRADSQKLGHLVNETVAERSMFGEEKEAKTAREIAEARLEKLQTASIPSTVRQESQQKSFREIIEKLNKFSKDRFDNP